MEDRFVSCTPAGFSEEQYAKAFHASPIAMALQTLRDERCVDVNESFLQITGFAREEVVGRRLAALGLYVDPIAHLEVMARLHEAKSIRHHECRLRTKAGCEREGLVWLDLFDAGGEPHVLLTVQDVTERLSLENQLRQSQKMEAVGQLAAGVAHDFNNILTIIQGHASLVLAQNDLARETAESLQQVVAATQRAAALTRQLLVFSRKQPTQPRVLNLSQVAGQLRPMLRSLLGEPIQFNADFAPGLPNVFADPSSVEQVLVNLALNAREAMPEGGQFTLRTARVQLDATTAHHPEARPGDFVCVTVSDTGHGMNREVLSHLFEPFFTTKEMGKGTGLGLATVYGIVKQHEGWIEVVSAVGQGSTFRIYLPVTTRKGDTGFEPREAPAGPSQHESILVVEDEDVVRQMACLALRQQGYHISEASNGAEALKKWQQRDGEFDLLLTDIVMPGGISGRILAETLLAGKPDLKIVYMSGYSLDLTGENFSARKGIYFLPKPFDIARLTLTVRKCLDSTRERTARAAVKG